METLLSSPSFLQAFPSIPEDPSPAGSARALCSGGIRAGGAAPVVTFGTRPPGHAGHRPMSPRAVSSRLGDCQPSSPGFQRSQGCSVTPCSHPSSPFPSPVPPSGVYSQIQTPRRLPATFTGNSASSIPAEPGEMLLSPGTAPAPH